MTKSGLSSSFPPLRKAQRVRQSFITMHAAKASARVDVSMYVTNLRAWKSVPDAQMDSASHAITDKLAGCVGLAANGAGTRRCPAEVSPPP